MSNNMLMVVGFIIGVISGFGCLATLIAIFGKQHFGMVAVSVFVGIGVGGFAQRSLIKRLMRKAIKDD